MTRKVHSIRFDSCKITYKEENLKNIDCGLGNKMSYVQWDNKIEFEDCNFIPNNQKAEIKEFLRKNTVTDKQTKIRFVNCVFKQRRRSLIEKITHLLPMQLNSYDLYLNGVARLWNSQLRMKQIPKLESSILKDAARIQV